MAAATSFQEIDQVYHPTGTWRDPPPSPPALGDSSDSFVAYNRSFPQRSDIDSYTWIELRHHTLIEAVKAIFPSSLALYGKQPGIDCRELYVQRRHLVDAIEAAKSDAHAQAILQQLLGFVEGKFAYVAREIASYPPNAISWKLLWSLVRTGEDIETKHDVTGEATAMQIDSWAYVTESMGRSFVMKCHYHQWTGISYQRINATRKIAEFYDLCDISELPTRPLSQAQRSALQARGVRYMSYAKQAHAQYKGFFFTRAFSGANRLLGDGQIVIDVKNFRKMNTSLDTWSDDINMDPALAAASISQFSESSAYLLPPSIHGFSLRAKRWGEFLLHRISDIEWQDRSFTHLVIPDSYRRVIRSLVTVHASDLKSQLLTDVVEGKGNGLIMALHGSPGTGKTLTAEAVAEHLRRPLYIVSAGELGTTVNVLEKQLKDVLELATSWNAVLLIDEADIFLEKRSLQQLERNALVGVFLRVLEYFSGVLILTTNALDSFDPAFLSRFALVLRFAELDKVARHTLWMRFLKIAGCTLSESDVDALADVKLNGRDIKHTIQTAQAIALVEKETLSMSHFDEVLAVAKTKLAI